MGILRYFSEENRDRRRRQHETRKLTMALAGYKGGEKPVGIVTRLRETCAWSRKAVRGLLPAAADGNMDALALFVLGWRRLGENDRAWVIRKEDACLWELFGKMADSKDVDTECQLVLARNRYADATGWRKLFRNENGNSAQKPVIGQLLQDRANGWKMLEANFERVAGVVGSCGSTNNDANDFIDYMVENASDAGKALYIAEKIGIRNIERGTFEKIVSRVWKEAYTGTCLSLMAEYGEIPERLRGHVAALVKQQPVELAITAFDAIMKSGDLELVRVCLRESILSPVHQEIRHMALERVAGMAPELGEDAEVRDWLLMSCNNEKVPYAIRESALRAVAGLAKNPEGEVQGRMLRVVERIIGKATEAISRGDTYNGYTFAVDNLIILHGTDVAGAGVAVRRAIPHLATITQTEDAELEGKIGFGAKWHDPNSNMDIVVIRTDDGKIRHVKAATANAMVRREAVAALRVFEKEFVAWVKEQNNIANKVAYIRQALGKTVATDATATVENTIEAAEFAVNCTEDMLSNVLTALENRYASLQPNDAVLVMEKFCEPIAIEDGEPKAGADLRGQARRLHVLERLAEIDGGRRDEEVFKGSEMTTVYTNLNEELTSAFRSSAAHQDATVFRLAMLGVLEKTVPVNEQFWADACADSNGQCAQKAVAFLEGQFESGSGANGKILLAYAGLQKPTPRMVEHAENALGTPEYARQAALVILKAGGTLDGRTVTALNDIDMETGERIVQLAMSMLEEGNAETFKRIVPGLFFLLPGTDARAPFGPMVAGTMRKSNIEDAEGKENFRLAAWYLSEDAKQGGERSWREVQKMLAVSQQVLEQATRGKSKREKELDGRFGAVKTPAEELTGERMAAATVMAFVPFGLLSNTVHEQLIPYAVKMHGNVADRERQALAAGVLNELASNEAYLSWLEAQCRQHVDNEKQAESLGVLATLASHDKGERIALMLDAFLDEAEGTLDVPIKDRETYEKQMMAWQTIVTLARTGKERAKQLLDGRLVAEIRDIVWDETEGGVAVEKLLEEYDGDLTQVINAEAARGCGMNKEEILRVYWGIVLRKSARMFLESVGPHS